MLSVEQCEAIRRAYYVDKKSIRQIARELRCSRKTVDKALASAAPAAYTRTVPYMPLPNWVRSRRVLPSCWQNVSSSRRSSATRR